mmetsp:Transcript_50774/g.162552  ORF Transcript_50774/g.162552 Transcript_50774/m.162552 type:complete len:321 (+) Transcript_50774:1899-2861(+)
MRCRARNPRARLWMRMAASSGVMPPSPRLSRRMSSACCALMLRMMRARSRPCLPRSFTWMQRMASSSPRGGSCASGASSAVMTLYLSTSASRNFSRSSSSLARSSTKYRGTGISSTSGVSFRSTRMSSRLMKSNPWLSFSTSQYLISRMRPMVASRAFFMSMCFWGCTIWSYASSSFLKIWIYLMYIHAYSAKSVGAREGSSGGFSVSSWSRSSIMASRHWISNVMDAMAAARPLYRLWMCLPPRRCPPRGRGFTIGLRASLVLPPPHVALERGYDTSPARTELTQKRLGRAPCRPGYRMGCGGRERGPGGGVGSLFTPC